MCVSLRSPCFKNDLIDLEDEKIRGAGELGNRDMRKYDVVESGKCTGVVVRTPASAGGRD